MSLGTLLQHGKQAEALTDGGSLCLRGDSQSEEAVRKASKERLFLKSRHHCTLSNTGSELAARDGQVPTAGLFPASRFTCHRRLFARRGPQLAPLHCLHLVINSQFP